jgi:hypothetical protein
MMCEICDRCVKISLLFVIAMMNYSLARWKNKKDCRHWQDSNLRGIDPVDF